MIKSGEIEKTYKIRLFEDSVAYKMIVKMPESIENKGFHRTNYRSGWLA